MGGRATVCPTEFRERRGAVWVGSLRQKGGEQARSKKVERREKKNPGGSRLGTNEGKPLVGFGLEKKSVRSGISFTDEVTREGHKGTNSMTKDCISR